MTKILIIEDNLEIRENTSELLQLSNYTVIEAMNGSLGLQMAKDHLPNLILCDIQMPETNGYQVFEELKKDPLTSSIPFIFVTASVEKKDIQAGLAMGANGYVRKPFEVEVLIAEIERCLGI